MKNIKRNKDSVRNIALSAIGYKYNVARRLRISMAISCFGSVIMQLIFQRSDTPESLLIKRGILATWGICLVKSVIDNKRISRDMERYDAIYDIIGRKDTNEVIAVDDVEKNVCKIEFPDKSYIEERIKDGIYSCIYNKSDQTIDITSKVKQLGKK